MPRKKSSPLTILSDRLTFWIGTPASIFLHTLAFVGIFFLRIFNVPTEDILLILTTAVSLEAIYLAIFIQMSVNKTTKSLATVEKDIDDIQEDVEDLEENVDDIQEDVEGLETNLKEVSDEVSEDWSEDDEVVVALKDISKKLENLKTDIDVLKRKGVI